MSLMYDDLLTCEVSQYSCSSVIGHTTSGCPSVIGHTSTCSNSISYTAVVAAPTPPLVPATIAVLVTPIPAAPIDCSVATTPPAAVGAHADIIEAAVEPATIPPAPNPKALTTNGAATTATVPAATPPPTTATVVPIPGITKLKVGRFSSKIEMRCTSSDFSTQHNSHN
uniref:Uncharacterized protein n=1 Tax=Amphimedon queenslandica TaxID=400682 RepID=A0A1X7UKA0_AMPQE